MLNPINAPLNSIGFFYKDGVRNGGSATCLHLGHLSYWKFRYFSQLLFTLLENIKWLFLHTHTSTWLYRKDFIHYRFVDFEIFAILHKFWRNLQTFKIIFDTIDPNWLLCHFELGLEILKLHNHNRVHSFGRL